MIAEGDALYGPVNNTSIISTYSYLGRNDPISFGVMGDDDGLLKMQKSAEAMHNRRGNIVFCDGHVEAMTFQTLFRDKDDASLRRWNRDNDPHRQ